MNVCQIVENAKKVKKSKKKKKTITYHFVQSVGELSDPD